MGSTIKHISLMAWLLILSSVGFAQYLNVTLENVSGTLQCNSTSLQEVYNGADWYEWDLDIIELYTNGTALLRNTTYTVSNTTVNQTLSRLETVFSCQSYVICRGILWNATAYRLEDGNITEIYESLNTSVYVNCTTTSTSTSTSTSTTVTTLTGLTNYPTWFSTPTTYINNRPKINISTGPNDTLPTGQGGLGNTTGLGTTILGMNKDKFIMLFVFILIGIVFLTVGQLSKRLGVMAGNLMLDFCVLVGGWFTIGMGPLVIINMIAVLYWYGGDD